MKHHSYAYILSEYKMCNVSEKWGNDRRGPFEKYSNDTRDLIYIYIYIVDGTPPPPWMLSLQIMG